MGFQFPIPGLATLLAMISAVKIRNVAHFPASDVELVAITLERSVWSKRTWVSDQMVYWIFTKLLC